MHLPTRRDLILAAARLGLVTIAAPAAVTGAKAQPASTRVTLVLVNDIDRMADQGGRGGYAKLASVAKAERARGQALLVHAGDAYSPSLLSGFDHGHHIVELLNRIAPDVFTPGNHEFDFGPENFRARVRQSTFPVLAANIYERDGVPVAGLARSRMIEMAGVKLGFVGVCTEQTAILSSPGDIEFRPAVETVRMVADELRAAGADIVVAVTHVGFGDDLLLVRTGAADVILSGHDHHLITYWDGRVTLVESASQGDFVTAVDLLVTRAGDGSRVDVVPNMRPIDTIGIDPDPELSVMIEGLGLRLDQELGVVIGMAATELDTRSAVLRRQENAFANLVCDAMRTAVKADICIINSGGIRANRILPAGTRLTRRHIMEELPFGNRTVLLKVSGRTIRAALENGFVGDGRFPQVSGMTVEADMRQPAGARLRSVSVGDAPLDDVALYTLASNDFMLRGGDGYGMLKEAEVLVDSLAGQYVAGHVMDFISKAGTVAPKVEHRLRLAR